MNNYYKKQQQGSVLTIVMVLFVVVALSIEVGLILPIVHSNRIAQNQVESARSYAIAESGVEDLVYRLNSGMQYSSTETLSIGTQQTTTTVTDVAGGDKQIESLGDATSRNRMITTVLTQGAGVSFNYGVQTGRGGITMNNGSQIIGNVYANGSVTGSGTVTGTAIAANTSALAADQVNETPSSPTHALTFRNGASTADIAQSFQPSSDLSINKIQLYIRKVGSPSNATIRIVDDNGGVPSTTNLLTSQGTLSASLVGTSYAWIEVVLPSNPTLFAGNTYWLVIDSSSTSSSNYYVLGANDNGYASGAIKIGAYAGSWSNPSPSTLDGYFKIYFGGLTAEINGITVGSAGVGDAWAHTITGGSVAGTKYCQVGTGCNTSRPDPSPQNFPVSDANIAAWKEDAAAGGTISGNYAPADGSSLGPKVITGNLTISNNKTINLTGRVWVQGNIILDNNSIVRLSPAYGTQDEVIIADGRITISNNSSFQNSGTSGSYIMALSTSTCPSDVSCGGANAIDVSNNAGAVILNAQKGTIYINNNANLVEATGEKLVLNNNAAVTYQSGLADMNFSTGPSGAWTVSSWKETQ